MVATRYMGKHGTHHGVISPGSLLTDCGRVFAPSRVLQLDRDPGERPPDPDQVGPECLRKVNAR